MVLLESKEELLSFLNEHSITPTNIIEHPEVFTVEAMMPHLEGLDGLVTKNLFLKDKKKKLYLLAALHSQDVDLGKLGKKVGASGGLRFADEAIMVEKLTVSQGCCTPLALFKDKANDVKLLIDSRFVESGVTVYSHPMVNNATIGLKAEDLKTFFQATGHEPVVVNFAEV